MPKEIGHFRSHVRLYENYKHVDTKVCHQIACTEYIVTIPIYILLSALCICTIIVVSMILKIPDFVPAIIEEMCSLRTYLITSDSNLKL